MMPLCSRRSRQALPDGSYSQIRRERQTFTRNFSTETEAEIQTDKLNTFERG